MARLLTICLALSFTGCSSYVRRAYWTSGYTSIRGYPTAEPPEGFTGVWTHYKHNGEKLAEVPYWNGEVHGTSFSYKDDGCPYLIRRYENGRFVEDYYIEKLTWIPSRIPFWYPARYLNDSVKSWNRSTTEESVGGATSESAPSAAAEAR